MVYGLMIWGEELKWVPEAKGRDGSCREMMGVSGVSG